MNVFRSLRNLWNTVALRDDESSGEKRAKKREGADPSPEDKAGLFRDGFERVTGGLRGAARTLYRPGREALGKDGFEAGFRGAPVDLTGGVKVPYLGVEEAPRPAAPAPSDFVASLDDLPLRMDPVNLAGEAVPAESWNQAPRVIDSFEDAATPLALDSFEPSTPVSTAHADELQSGALDPRSLDSGAPTTTELSSTAPVWAEQLGASRAELLSTALLLADHEVGPAEPDLAAAFPPAIASEPVAVTFAAPTSTEHSEHAAACPSTALLLAEHEVGAPPSNGAAPVTAILAEPGSMASPEPSLDAHASEAGAPADHPGKWGAAAPADSSRVAAPLESPAVVAVTALAVPTPERAAVWPEAGRSNEATDAAFAALAPLQAAPSASTLPETAPPASQAPGPEPRSLASLVPAWLMPPSRPVERVSTTGKTDFVASLDDLALPRDAASTQPDAPKSSESG